jgi:hypothetical protein
MQETRSIYLEKDQLMLTAKETAKLIFETWDGNRQGYIDSLPKKSQIAHSPEFYETHLRLQGYIQRYLQSFKNEIWIIE